MSLLPCSEWPSCHFTSLFLSHLHLCCLQETRRSHWGSWRLKMKRGKSSTIRSLESNHQRSKWHHSLVLQGVNWIFKVTRWLPGKVIYLTGVRIWFPKEMHFRHPMMPSVPWWYFYSLRTCSSKRPSNILTLLNLLKDHGGWKYFPNLRSICREIMWLYQSHSWSKDASMYWEHLLLFPIEEASHLWAFATRGPLAKKGSSILLPEEVCSSFKAQFNTTSLLEPPWILPPPK